MKVGLQTCNGIWKYLSNLPKFLQVAFQLLFHQPKNTQIDKSVEERKIANTITQLMSKSFGISRIGA
jgi:hypothetical protein